MAEEIYYYIMDKHRCFISDAIKETLTEYRKWLGGRNCSPDDYIFSKNNGGKLQEQSYSRYLKNAGKEAGLPIRSCWNREKRYK